MIPRRPHTQRVLAALRASPVVGVLGARQIRKTTLARQLARTHPGAVHWFDLEDPRDLALLVDPMPAPEELSGLVVLDDIAAEVKPLR